MPRDSRHKSTRSHKHRDGRDRPDSDDDVPSRERKPRAEETPAASSAVRVSREVDPEKQKPSPRGNGDAPGEHGRKRKDRTDDSDRWTGGGEDGRVLDKTPKSEGPELADSKGRSSRSERNGESSGKAELAKRRSEKEPSRRESQHKDVKDKDRERDQVKDSKEQDKDYVKESKERDKDYLKDEKEREKDHSRNAKEKEIEYYKNEKERDKDRGANSAKGANNAKEKDRDRPEDAKERDKDNSKDAKVKGEKDNSKDTKERERDYNKDLKERERERERERDGNKDAKERERTYIKVAKEREREYPKDIKEKDRDRGSDRDKKGQDLRHERSGEMEPRKHISNANSSQEEYASKKDARVADRKVQDGLCNIDLEKELDKHIRRRDDCGDKHKLLDDAKGNDERRLSSGDDHPKNGSHKTENHREKYRNNCRDDYDRDQKHRDDRNRGERYSKDGGSNTYDNRHSRDENINSENRYKKSKIQDSDHEGSHYLDDRGTKFKDNRGRKRSSEQSDDHMDLKPRSAKEPREDPEKQKTSSTSRFDSHTDKARLDYLTADKVDTSLSSNRTKGSGSGNHSFKEQSSSKQARSSCRKTDDAYPRGDHASILGNHERVLDTHFLEKTISREGGDELVDDDNIRHEKSPKSEIHTSPSLPTVKSSSTNDRRLSDRIIDRTGSRRSLDVEGQKNSSSRDGKGVSNIRDRKRCLPLEKPNSGDFSPAEMPKGAGQSSSNRTSHFSYNSPSHLPPLPTRHGSEAPRGLGPSESDNKVHTGERKPSNRYRRNELGMGRGQGNTWNSAPTWPSPVSNGFIPLQHGPPNSGFHTPLHQYPGSPMFGVRPMELNHPGVPYQGHDAGDRFPGHIRPFGWHNPVDNCSPHMQAWDGSASIFGDESHVYGRLEWDSNKHLIGSREWEMRADMWKGKNRNLNVDIPVQQEPEYLTHAPDDNWGGQMAHNEKVKLEHPLADNNELKSSNDMSPAKNTEETPRKCLQEKRLESAKVQSVPLVSEAPTCDGDTQFCSKYLAMLDISLDLVRPELYSQFQSLMGTEDAASVYTAIKCETPTDGIKEEAVVTKRSDILGPLLPKKEDTVYQRAMSLYKKQIDGRKARHSELPYVCKLPKSSEADNLMEVDYQASLDASLVVERKLPEDLTSADVLLANANSASNIEEDGNMMVASGSHPGESNDQESVSDAVPVEASADLLANAANNNVEDGNLMVTSGSHHGDSKGRRSDSISDAVLVEGIQSCEALLPECRVNLSRIHLSPGSTH